MTLPTATPAIAPMLLLSGGAVVLSEDDTNTIWENRIHLHIQQQFTCTGDIAKDCDANINLEYILTYPIVQALNPLAV